MRVLKVSDGIVQHTITEVSYVLQNKSETSSYSMQYLFLNHSS